jgi:predicted GIY-YIG superfamily endonuclease
MSGFVYAIENNDGLIKIGSTKNPEKRIRSIETASGRKAVKKFISKRIVNYKSTESFMLWEYDHKRVLGEWFSGLDFDDVTESITRQSDIADDIFMGGFGGKERKIKKDRAFFVSEDIVNAFRGVRVDTHGYGSKALLLITCIASTLDEFNLSIKSLKEIAMECGVGMTSAFKIEKELIRKDVIKIARWKGKKCFFMNPEVATKCRDDGADHINGRYIVHQNGGVLLS